MIFVRPRRLKGNGQGQIGTHTVLTTCIFRSSYICLQKMRNCLYAKWFITVSRPMCFCAITRIFEVYGAFDLTQLPSATFGAQY